MVGSSLVDTRSVFFRKQQKWKILIFRFCRYRGFRGEAPNAVIGFFPMVKCALWESFLRLFRETSKRAFFRCYSKMKTPSNGAYKINIRYIWAHKRICGIQA